MARYRLQEMLAYISTEIHKTFSPLFNPATPPDTRTSAVTKLQARYALIEQALSKQAFLLGSQFTVADAYLFTVTNWAHQLKIDLSQFPKLLAFQKEVAARPAVQSALLEEGLIH
jgi:glutathione S-transferase